MRPLSLQQVGQWMSGKKTFLGWIALGVLGILWSSGVIGDEQTIAAGVVIRALTGVSERLAISKAEKADS